ncbi:unnamed protein product (macronuclear) [Paramecium tetraurelia]|uniref:Cyclic nucleotide-binding domain-containing protein n=1 Tax=Paramecium tetraurelia TaxID=5888 RepID=A0BUH6_PARTE|nr:uncharacterized protein GSPATT00032425001 [Paramecium tetraurelia]CAK62193.1 unnamed protein product [Paramecium tetraurelia]|eukprot:XP_001429591.1 hypothetical protein (macronuclear) [Paramecium tetraurelia strain d4-2]
MISSQNFESDPYTLIITKRQIFGSENESNLHKINKQHSLMNQEDNLSQENKHLNFIELIQSRSSMIPTVKVVSPENEQILQNEDGFYFQSSLHLNEGLNPTWQKGGLKIINYVAKFMYQLKTKADKLKIKLMNYEIFMKLGDKSGDFQNFKKGNQKQKLNNLIHLIFNKMIFQIIQIWNLISQSLNKIAIIYPESTFKIIWDSVVVCFIVINIFFIPMSLSFELDKSSQISTLLFETIPSYIFIVEILLNFNTAYYSQGIIHTNRSQIFFHYLSNNFIWDLLIAIPFILAQFNIPYIQFILLLRIARVRSMIQNVEDLLNAKEEVQAVIELGKLVYFLVLVAHMCSCGWHLLGRIEYEVYQDENSWLIYYGHYDQQWYDRYIVSLYWSVITTLTVGYGDIVPQTTIERLYVVIVAMVLCGVFGYIISMIGEILKTLGEKKALLKRSMKKVNQYIKQKQLNIQLSLKIRKYFEFKHQIDEQLQEQDDSVLNKLSGSLKQEVLIDIYKPILMKSKFLKENIPDYLINNLCQRIKQATFAPGFDIVNVYDPATKLIFILDGQVNSYFISKGFDALQRNEKESNSGMMQRNYQRGDIIGELEFIINSSYQFYFKAQTVLSIVYIERSDFLQVIQENEECRQKFHQLREKLTYQKTYGRTCDVCKWTHRYKDCPFVFYQTNIYKIARNANISQNHQRLKFDRPRDTRKKQTNNDHYNILNQSIDFIINNGYLNEDQLNESYLIKLGFDIQEGFYEKSIQSQESQSQESHQQDNHSVAQRKCSSQIEKVRASLKNQKLKSGLGQNQNLTRNQNFDDDSNGTQYNPYFQLQRKTENEIQIEPKESSNSNPFSNHRNLTNNTIKQNHNLHSQGNLKSSVANHIARTETSMAKKSLISQQKPIHQSLKINNNNNNLENDTEKSQQQHQLQPGGTIYYIPELEFDKMKNYDFYFPQFNVVNILESLKKYRVNQFNEIKKKNIKEKLKSIRQNKTMSKCFNSSFRNVDEST